MNAAHTLHRLGLTLGLLAATLVRPLPLGATEVVSIAGSDGSSAPAWVGIENDTFEQRAHFEAGMRGLSARLDEQIRILRAKRSKMTTDVKDWDFAMKEVDASRSYLTGVIREVHEASTEEAWTAAKEKAGEAWKRSQLAIDKVNSTVTS
jgi:hypothetical protein